MANSHGARSCASPLRGALERATRSVTLADISGYFQILRFCVHRISCFSGPTFVGDLVKKVSGNVSFSIWRPTDGLRRCLRRPSSSWSTRPEIYPEIEDMFKSAFLSTNTPKSELR